jgi:hypothetical protein
MIYHPTAALMEKGTAGKFKENKPAWVRFPIVLRANQDALAQLPSITAERRKTHHFTETAAGTIHGILAALSPARKGTSMDKKINIRHDAVGLVSIFIPLSSRCFAKRQIVAICIGKRLSFNPLIQ